MPMTTRRKAALGGLLAAAAAPLIALSTSAVAAADPDSDPIGTETTDEWGPVDNESGVGDVYDVNYLSLGPIGTTSFSEQEYGSASTGTLVFGTTTYTFADYINGVANGDSIIENSSLDGYIPAGGSEEYWTNTSFETLNSAGSVINLTDDIDLFGHTFTLFDIPL
jgi:hypothetical protein